jgi:hypothetical protein
MKSPSSRFSSALAPVRRRTRYWTRCWNCYQIISDVSLRGKANLTKFYFRIWNWAYRVFELMATQAWAGLAYDVSLVIVSWSVLRGYPCKWPNSHVFRASLILVQAMLSRVATFWPLWRWAIQLVLIVSFVWGRECDYGCLMSFCYLVRTSTPYVSSRETWCGFHTSSQSQRLNG